MTSPKRRGQIDRRRKRRETYRRRPELRPGEATAPTRPAAERRAEPDRAAEEARLLSLYTKVLRGSALGEVTIDEVRKWRSLSDAERDDLRRACWSGGRSILAEDVSKRIGLHVDRIHEFATA